MKFPFFLLLLFWAHIGIAQKSDSLFQSYHAGDQVQPNKKEALLKIVIVDLRKLKMKDLPVSVVQLPSGKVWAGITGKFGEIYFKVPRGMEYRIAAGDEPELKIISIEDEADMIKSLTLTYLPKTFSETVQGDTVSQKVPKGQTPTRDRLLLLAFILDLDDKPIKGEQLFFRAKTSKKVYTATTDKQGYCALMLPKGEEYCFSIHFFPNLKCYEVPNHDMAGQLKITLNTFGTQAILAQKAEQARKAAVRDSVLRVERTRDSLEMARRLLKETDFVIQFTYGGHRDSVLKLIQRRCEKERQELAKDPLYFQKTGESVKAVFYRMAERWKNKVIVTDLTGSMSPYMDQVLIWHALQLIQNESNLYVFFNDGNNTPDAKKVIGHTGGLYFSNSAELSHILEKMGESVNAGFGGDSEENDLEAALAGAAIQRPFDELILIADNYSPVRDMELLPKLKIPVHIILCGTELGINTDYLEIAFKTKGSIHTLDQDIQNLAALSDGQTIGIGDSAYRISRGKFLKVSKL